MNTQHIPRPHAAADRLPARSVMRIAGAAFLRRLADSSPVACRMSSAPEPPCHRPRQENPDDPA